MIEFPKVERIIFQQAGNKNSIRQLIIPPVTKVFTILERGAKFVRVQCDSQSYYLTTNKRDVPEEEAYVLLTTELPPAHQPETSRIIGKKWLRHPGLKEISVTEVLASWKNAFVFKVEEPGNTGLRQPQLGALYTILGHLTLPLDMATVVLPTGTGKTETMLAALLAHPCQKLLVTAPSDSLRSQLANKFYTLGLLREFKLISASALYPIVGIVKEKFASIDELELFFQKCNVVVTTMNILTGCSQPQQEMIATQCSHVFVDEAHHMKAASWNSFKNKFAPEKVIQFTATPFRNDGKRLDGKIIFNFPLKKAQEQGYFKKIEFISFREYDKEKADSKIAQLAVERLREDRQKGYNHILMARCYPKERAQKIFTLYQEHADLNPVLIYSGSPDFRASYEKILKKKPKSLSAWICWAKALIYRN